PSSNQRAHVASFDRGRPRRNVRGSRCTVQSRSKMFRRRQGKRWRSIAMASPEEMVRRGYDAAAERYAASRDQLENERHHRLFTQSLPPPAAVLDVGCGSGRPVAAYMVDEGYKVT